MLSMGPSNYGTTAYQLADIERPFSLGVSKRRWWVLFWFCIASINQAAVWLSLSANAQDFFKVYGWDDRFVSWFLNISSISYTAVIYPNALFLKKYGSGTATIVSAFIVAVGTLLRCIPFEDPSIRGNMMLISNFIIGIAGPWVNFGGPILSEIWFPVSERVLATGIGSVATYLGSVVAYAVGPAFIYGKEEDVLKAQIDLFFWVQAIFCTLTFLIVYFTVPNEPPRAPSVSAARKRMQRTEAPSQNASNGANPPYPSTWKGWLGLDSSMGILQRKKIRQFWLLNLAYSLPSGLFQGWSSILDLNLTNFGVSKNNVALLGIWMTLSGCIGSVIIGYFMDRFQGILKTGSAVFMLMTTLSVICFCTVLGSSMDNKPILPVTLLWLNLTCICAGLFFNSSTPLFYELVMETIYGALDENGAFSIMIGTMSVVQIFMLAVPTEINGSSFWIDMSVLGSCAISLVIILAFRPVYYRLRMDTNREHDSGNGFEDATTLVHEISTATSNTANDRLTISKSGDRTTHNGVERYLDRCGVW